MTASETDLATALDLWQGWLELWNGDLAQAERIVAPGLVTHAALVGGGTGIPGRDGLVGWIRMLRDLLSEPVFSVEVGPVTDGRLLGGRWSVAGHYAGGFPGATAAVGTPMSFTGTDTLRIEDGRLAEYWLNSDTHVMLAQLGVRG